MSSEAQALYDAWIQDIDQAERRAVRCLGCGVEFPDVAGWSGHACRFAELNRGDTGPGGVYYVPRETA